MPQGLLKLLPDGPFVDAQALCHLAQHQISLDRIPAIGQQGPDGLGGPGFAAHGVEVPLPGELFQIKVEGGARPFNGAQ